MSSISLPADPIVARLDTILKEIARASAELDVRAVETQALRPQGVKLEMVIKGQPDSAVLSAISYLQSLGKLAVIAENFLQDHWARSLVLPDGVESHFIGVLQSNKVREIVREFGVIESVGSERYARIIDAAAAKIGKVQKIFLQINISDDAAKSGFSADAALAFVASAAPRLNAIEIDGVMTITKWYDNPEDARPDFIALREVGGELAKLLGRPLELSMGMSRDFVLAIKEGATLVRVGSAIFGERS